MRFQKKQELGKLIGRTVNKKMLIAHINHVLFSLAINQLNFYNHFQYYCKSVLR